MTSTTTGGAYPEKYKRKLRNYLLDAGLQLRYTAYIVVLAAGLTGVLGFQIYDATRDTSKIIAMTNMVDPAVGDMLKEQFKENDRKVLWGILGFGLVLILSMSAMGIVVTHKVAGPARKLTNIVGRVRDNKLGPPIRDLRKGDQLRELHDGVREMHEALRTRTEEDVKVMNEALQAMEDSGAAKHPAVDRLRQLMRVKEDSLEGTGLHPTATQ